MQEGFLPNAHIESTSTQPELRTIQAPKSAPKK